NSTTFDGVLAGFAPSSLMFTVKDNDRHQFVYWGLKQNMDFGKTILKKNYPINSFVDDLYTQLGSPLLDSIWTRIYGNPGNIIDELKLSELNIYGSKRIGIVNVDTSLVKVD